MQNKSSAPKLRELQRLFQGALRSSHRLEKHFPKERLAYYSYSCRERQVSSLMEDFESTVKLLGKRRFRKLALSYLEAQPSRSAHLLDLGARFPPFLKRRASLKAYKAALYDWQFIECRDLLSAEPLSNQSSSISAQTRLRRSPSMRLLKATHHHAFIHGPQGVVAYNISAAQYRVLACIGARPRLLRNLARQIPASVNPVDLQHWFSQWHAAGLIEIL